MPQIPKRTLETIDLGSYDPAWAGITVTASSQPSLEALFDLVNYRQRTLKALAGDANARVGLTENVREGLAVLIVSTNATNDADQPVAVKDLVSEMTGAILMGLCVRLADFFSALTLDALMPGEKSDSSAPSAPAPANDAPAETPRPVASPPKPRRAPKSRR